MCFHWLYLFGQPSTRTKKLDWVLKLEVFCLRNRDSLFRQKHKNSNTLAHTKLVSQEERMENAVLFPNEPQNHLE